MRVVASHTFEGVFNALELSSTFRASNVAPALIRVYTNNFTGTHELNILYLM